MKNRLSLRGATTVEAAAETGAFGVCGHEFIAILVTDEREVFKGVFGQQPFWVGTLKGLGDTAAYVIGVFAHDGLHEEVGADGIMARLSQGVSAVVHSVGRNVNAVEVVGRDVFDDGARHGVDPSA